MRKDRFMKREEVQQRTSLSRSTLYALMSEGKFPRPHKLSKRSVAWRESLVVGWMNEQAEVNAAA